MPKAHRMNYWYITSLWFTACVLFIVIGYILPVVGWLLILIGLIGLPFTPFAMWMLLVLPCPYCGKEDIQLSWKGSYPCPRCKQVVLIFRGDKSGEYETRKIER